MRVRASDASPRPSQQSTNHGAGAEHRRPREDCHVSQTRAPARTPDRRRLGGHPRRRRQPALAQTSADDGNTLEELVVTAEKREQSLQDVPVAVSAFTSAKRDVVGIVGIQDFVNFTPGMNYSGTDRVSLRGAG